MKQLCAVAVAVMIALISCGDDPAPAPDVPSWAKVAPEQIAEAAKHGVPVAFENDLGMRFVLIPAGTFLMGSPEDEEGRRENETQHEVTISQPFYVQVMEVTNEAYRRHRADHDAEELTRLGDSPGVVVVVHPTTTSYPGYYGPELNENQQPVTCVTWLDAAAFAGWVSSEDARRVYRLPTEAEWEYACRAGTTTRTAFGAALTRSQANVGRDRFESGPNPRGSTNPAEVGNYRPNRWGIYDMHGNVHEWCADWFAAYGPDAAQDPTGARDGTSRVVRGGDARTQRSAVRSARRWHLPPEYWTGWGWVGFRLISPLPESDQGSRR